MQEAVRDVTPQVTVSIVSHGQGGLLQPLLSQLRELAAVLPMQVIVTLNLPEARPFVDEAPCFDLTWIENVAPKGFGENHNAAFALCTGACFCVLNPDIRLVPHGLAPLFDYVRLYPGVVGPRVVSPQGRIEDSARQVLSPWRLFRRLSKYYRKVDYLPTIPVQRVEWVAGMCMLFDHDSFRDVVGFALRYRLYCEDTDICLRIHLLGRSVTWVQEAVVVHDAQRTSHRNWRYLAWHVASLMRLFSSKTYWRYRLGVGRAGIQAAGACAA